MSRKKTRQCRERGHNSCAEGAKRLRNTTALGTVSSGHRLASTTAHRDTVLFTYDIPECTPARPDDIAVCAHKRQAAHRTIVLADGVGRRRRRAELGKGRPVSPVSCQRRGVAEPVRCDSCRRHTYGRRCSTHCRVPPPPAAPPDAQRQLYYLAWPNTGPHRHTGNRKP